MYHKFGVSKYPSTNITLEQFESHLQEFSLSKYKVLSLEFILDTIINDGQLPNNTIGISVDDADKSFLTTAWPKFKEKNLPVTLFVSTSTIVDNNKNYLNWNQIRQLKNEGVTIGAHSHTHNHLTELSNTEIIDEIELSNNIFLKELGVIPSLFAYPYGETNEKIINLLKNYKFKVAFGQHSGVINETSNLYYLPRFSLNEKYGDIKRFKFLITMDADFSHDPKIINKMSDEEAIIYLSKLRQIGRWSAEMILLFTFNRPNIWPVQDIGLLRAISNNYKKKYLPPVKFINVLKKRFDPYCSVATWYLWRSIDNEPIQY